MNVVHFGAGNIGKGLIGAILSQSGFNVTYIDADHETVNSINQNKGFIVQVIGEEDFFINNVNAFHVSENENIQNSLIKANLITTSVGATNLAKISTTILQSLLKRAELNLPPVDIIANENMINASTSLKKEIYKIASPKEQMILDEKAIFSNSAIDRLALSNENGTLVEPYAEWVIEETNIINSDVKNIKGATYTNNMTQFIERKLFCVNANHAAAAYLAYQKNLSYIYEAFEDQEILDIINGMHKEILEYFVDVYGVDSKEHEKFINKTMKRHGNNLLHDSVIRVGASPLRKLGPTERLVGPFLELSKRDLPRTNIARIIASALQFVPDNDTEAQEIQKRGYTEILKEHCKVNKNDDIQLILQLIK